MPQGLFQGGYLAEPGTVAGFDQALFGAARLNG
jgi:hypothetical protein